MCGRGKCTALSEGVSPLTAVGQLLPVAAVRDGLRDVLCGVTCDGLCDGLRDVLCGVTRDGLCDGLRGCGRFGTVDLLPSGNVIDSLVLPSGAQL